LDNTISGKEKNFQDEEPLLKIILKIMAELQPVRTRDIGCKLGENYRCRISQKEILEVLSYLKRRKRISAERQGWKIGENIYPKWRFYPLRHQAVGYPCFLTQDEKRFLPREIFPHI